MKVFLIEILQKLIKGYHLNIKQLILAFILISCSFLQAQNQNNTNCAPDGKFDYDVFEKILIEFKENEKIEILPRFKNYIEECRTASDLKKCLEEKFLWFDLEHLNEREGVVQTPEIQNGITIISISVCANDPGGPIIAFSADRHNQDEDLMHGTSGDGSGLMLGGATEGELWMYMEQLFEWTTLGSTDNIGEDYIALFKTNTSNAFKYFHSGLCEEVIKSLEMKNFIKRFGQELNEILKGRGGNFPT